MPESPVVVVARTLRDALRGLEPERLSGEGCATLAEELAGTAKACVAAQARLASRAADAGAHHRRGYANAVDWLAHSAGSSTGQAREVLGTAHAADALVALTACRGRGKSNRADVVIVWDRTAAMTSSDHEGTAHIVGGGPIPVGVARRLAERAFVKALVHDGVRIETVRTEE